MSDIIEITDFNHKALDPYARMTERQLYNRRDPDSSVFIAESATVVTLALDAGYTPVSLLVEQGQLDRQGAPIIERCAGVPVYTASNEALSSLTGFHLSRGIMAVFKRPSLPTVEQICRGARRIAVLEDMMDAANVGAVIRSAAALGMDAVLVSPSTSDPLIRRSARVSMGTVFQIPWTYIPGWHEDGVAQLKSLGFITAAMALCDDSISIADPRLKHSERLALILGTEGTGLRPDTVAACDYTVRIPMHHNVDSLNVASAGAVAFWTVNN